MSGSTDEESRLREAAQRVAERLRSVDGVRTLTNAAEATSRRIAATREAVRLDPQLLQKRVTF